MRPALWTWTRIDINGASIQYSVKTFTTYRKALGNAVASGFNSNRDRLEILDSSNAADIWQRQEKPAPAELGNSSRAQW